MDGIIAKALAKDRDMRYQNVEELPADLKALDTASLSQSRISTMTQPIKDSQPLKNSRLPWVVAGVMMLLGAAGLWYGWRANSGDRPVSGVKRVSLSLTQSEGLRIVGRFALSPDGTMLTFLGQSEGREKLYLRHLDKNEITALAGTEGAVRPFFSPDSRWIGFFVGSTLRKVAVEGGAPSDICEAGVATANWGDNDEIIFSDGVALMRVSAQGGIPEFLPTDESLAGVRAILPRILPGGRHVLYTSIPATGAIDEGSIVVQSIESGEKLTLIQGGTNPHYLPTGHIVYESSGTLIAVPFDIGSLTITGPRSPLGEQVSTEATGHANFTMSMDGSMIYSSANLQAGELVWTNRQGVATPVSAPAHSYWDPRLSPDGRQVAVNRRDLSPEIWLLELARGTQTRLTVNPGEDETAFWSPDSRWIAFASQRTGHPRTLFRKRVAGSDAEEQLWTSSNHFHVECWSRDGRSIIVTDRDPATGDDLWLISLEDEISAQPLLQTRFNEFGGRLSPDGRWLAYTSNESGRLEVYVQAFPVLGTKTQISINGGSQPVWAATAKELFYRGEGHLMAVSITYGETFTISLPKPLFTDHYMNPAAKHTSYDVASDGERFLMLRSDAQNNVTSLNVVFNWFEEVKRLAPEGK
jgi:Tol biopolymer transport system component